MRYLERFLATEAIPTLAEIPGYPAADYAQTVLGRFENTGVRDQIARLCIDGTAKFPTFLIPTVERQLELGGPVECAALALAGWARYLATVPAAERAPDTHGARSVELAAQALEDPRAFLELDLVFTPRLRESERFTDGVRACVCGCRRPRLDRRAGLVSWLSGRRLEESRGRSIASRPMCASSRSPSSVYLRALSASK